jgi:hypothetical protein
MPDPFTQLLHDWQNFYLLTGTAAATLTGLMFVAASLGASLVTPATTTSVRTFVTPTIIHFSAVLITATLITIPTETALLLSSLLGLGGLAGLSYTITTALHLWRHHHRVPLAREDWFWHVGIPLMSYLLILSTALGVLLSPLQALNGLALAVIGLLVLGIRNAWDLTLWIAQQRQA